MKPRSRTEAAVMRSLEALVEPLNRSLPGPSEVVLHDLGLIPHSIVAIAGTVTGRKVGGPATDMLLQAAARGDYSTLVGYENQLPDGRSVRTTTIIVNGDGGRAMAALCLTFEVTMWAPVRSFLESILPGGTWPGTPPGQPELGPAPESFPENIDQLAGWLLERAIDETGVPVPLMHKRHKLAIVQRLQTQGFFQLREAAERAASRLGVTRFTIYNYLNEITTAEREIPGSAPGAQTPGSQDRTSTTQR